MGGGFRCFLHLKMRFRVLNLLKVHSLGFSENGALFIWSNQRGLKFLVGVDAEVILQF